MSARCQAWVLIPDGLMNCGQPANAVRRYACDYGHVKTRATCPAHAWLPESVGCLDCLSENRDCELKEIPS